MESILNTQRNLLAAWTDFCRFMKVNFMEYLCILYIIFFLLLYWKLVHFSRCKRNESQIADLKRLLLSEALSFIGITYAVYKPFFLIIVFIMYYSHYAAFSLYFIVQSLTIYSARKDFIKLKDAIKNARFGSCSQEVKQKSSVEKEIHCSKLNKFNVPAVSLWKAAHGGNLEYTQTLLQQEGMCSFIHCYFGPNRWTVLQAAIAAGSVSVVKVLLAHSKMDDFIETQYKDVIHLAISFNHHKVLFYLLNTVPKLKQTMNDVSSTYTKSALEMAISKGHLKCVKVLIKSGARLVHRISDYNILHMAAQYEQTEIAKYLLKNYPEIRSMVDKPTYFNQPIDFAIETRNWAMAELFIYYGAGTSSFCEKNILSRIYSHTELFHLDRVALKLGANPNLKEGCTGDSPIGALVQCEESLDSVYGLSDPAMLILIHTQQHLHTILCKLALLIQHGYDTRYSANLQTWVSNALTTYLLDQASCDMSIEEYTKYKNGLLGLLHESGYRFEAEISKSEQSFFLDDQNMADVIADMKRLDSMPLSLQRLCGNTIRVALQPNTTVVQKLDVASSLKDLILLESYPKEDYLLV